MGKTPRVTSLRVAAIDAGSNAIRLLIARVEPPRDIHILKAHRYSVRLGRGVFTRGSFDEETLREAERVFSHFHRLLKRYHVDRYRAVATSATRESHNQRLLLERIQRSSGIRLEVIDGDEESRLERVAVLSALRSLASPRAILDLGGGSLEVSFLKHGRLEWSLNLAVGTVRLMERLGLDGPIPQSQVERIRRILGREIGEAIPGDSPPAGILPPGALAVACGGNAEALARIAPGRPLAGQDTLDLALLRRRLPAMLRLDVAGRRGAYQVRRDRAEVMGIAAIVLEAMGRWLGVRSFLVPGVGVREGVIEELVESHQWKEKGEPGGDGRNGRGKSESLLRGARWLARHLRCDHIHSEHVRRIAVSLFEQTHPVHGLGPEERSILEAAALLHDCGHFLGDTGHHAHGAYLVRHARAPGLSGWRREMVAALVRYHNTRSDPDKEHPEYAALGAHRRRQVRLLAALLRLAEALDSGHRGALAGVTVELHGETADFRVFTRKGSKELLDGAKQKAELFERVYGLKARFQSSRTNH